MPEAWERQLWGILAEWGVELDGLIELPLRLRMNLIPEESGWCREDSLTANFLIRAIHNTIIKIRGRDGQIQIGEKLKEYLHARPHLWEEHVKPLFADSGTEVALDCGGGIIYFKKSYF